MLHANRYHLWAVVLCFVVLLAGVTAYRAAEEKDSGDWSLLSVPGVWEDQANGKFAKHDGFAWYRCYVKVPDRWVNKSSRSLWVQSVTLTVEHLADAHEVFVNGVKVGSTGSMPPKFVSGREESNRYKIPSGILQKGHYNTIAIRAYNHEGSGGFKGRAPVIAGYFLECILKGNWQFRTGDDKNWAIKSLPAKPKHATFESFNQATSALVRPKDFTPGRSLPPRESLARMKVADDLVLDQVLTEPLVAQPLQLRFDAQGRLWVVQYRQYPYPAGLKMVSRDKYYRAVYDKVPPPPPNHDRGADRISIHEDTDGDGVYDRHKVFVDGLNIATALAFGRGGVWVLNPPYLLFYPDRNGDDVPDGDPVVHLEGFGLEDTHSVVNSLTWGPDGWLYGAQGSTVSSHVKVRGTKRPSVYCEGPGMWRYHPQTRVYEIFAEGGGNAFGIEIDSQGRLYSGHNGGNTRGFHYVQGGYLNKGASGKYGKLSNLFAFGMLPYMAHAPIPRFSHTFVKYEGDTLPKQYHGKMFSADPLHRNLVLVDMQPAGSTFKTKDIGNPLTSDDFAFRPVEIKVGPDGGVYVADLCEEFIAHGQHFQGQINNASGRVYRLRAKDAKAPKPFNLNMKTTQELAELLKHPNKWHRQTALRLIAQRQDRSIVPALQQMLKNEKGQLALESFWLLNLLHVFDEGMAETTLSHANPHVRAWTVRLLGDDRQVSQTIGKRLIALAEGEKNAEVRKQLAATAKRLPVEYCLPIAENLLMHDEDLKDVQIPLLIYWAIESKAKKHPDAVLSLFKTPGFWQRPLVSSVILDKVMRRYATAGGRRDLLVCARLLELAPDAASRKKLMAGFELSFKGRTLANIPPELAKALTAAGGGSPALRIRLGDTKAIELALKELASPKTDKAKRIEYALLFGEVNQPRSVDVMLTAFGSTGDSQLLRALLGGLQGYNEERIGTVVVQNYRRLPREVHDAAQSLLASRKSWARLFLQAIDTGAIDYKTIPIDLVRQMTIHQDTMIASLIQKHWKSIDGASTEEMHKQMARLQTVMKAGSGNPYAGRELFNKTCAKCHLLFGEGGRIGPDLTSYQRDDLPRMLLNVVNPSVEIREGFESYVVLTADSRVLTGFLFDQDNKVVVLRGADGQNITVPRAQIEEMIRQKKSLMPEGLVKELSDQQVRDLFAYLRSGQPFPK